jgi:large subunit ribosomal protein L15
LSEIEKRYNNGETVDESTLHSKGLIKGRKKGDTFTPASPVKILANGDLTKKLVFKIAAISGSAKEKIQKAGGEVPACSEKPAAESSGQ